MLSTLLRKSSLSDQHRTLSFSTWIATNWPTCIWGYWPPSTFDLRWPVTTLSVASAVALSVCRSVGHNSRLEINSRAMLAWQSAGVSRNSALTYTYLLPNAQTMASSRCRSIVSKQQTNGMLLPLSINKTDERSDGRTLTWPLHRCLAHTMQPVSKMV